VRVIGRRRWVIAEGYIPDDGEERPLPLQSHETACLLNAGARPAHVTLTVFFTDRGPAGPFRVTVPPRRTLHLRFNELEDPERLPKDTDFASLIESDVPIVVQHTRLDARPARIALLSTLAFAGD
jgi:hypothetical protein